MLRYLKRPTIPFGPNAGTLYADVRRQDHLYIANSTFRDFRTGVILDIPAGVSVELTPLYANARLQIDMIPETVHGPRDGWEPVVRIWNNSNATVKLLPNDPIASIRAFNRPATLMWQDGDSIEARREDVPNSAALVEAAVSAARGKLKANETTGAA